MKIAILSDIHGNMPALTAVADHITCWQPDAVIVNGDTVNRGAESVAAWAFVQAQGWPHTLGNHEGYVSNWAEKEFDPQNRQHRFNALSHWTWRQFGAALPPLRQLPASLRPTAVSASQLIITHASIHHNRDGLKAHMSDEELRQKMGAETAVFVTSHTHKAFTRQVGDTLLLNTGSVGQPCDGDVRASYGQVVERNGRWQASVVRVPYDRAAANRAFHTAGFLQEAGAIAHLIYHEWRSGWDVVVPWTQRYGAAILAGEIGLETAVNRELTDRGLPPLEDGS